MPLNPNAKDRLFSTGLKSANTNVLAANVTPSESPAILEVTSAVNATATASIAEWNGTVLETYSLNNGSDVAGGAVHTEAVPVRESSEYNVQYDTDVQISALLIDERDYYKS